MKKVDIFLLLLTFSLCSVVSVSAQRKQMIDFFMPMEPQKPLVSKGVWGEANVLPRDTANGLEDISRKWDFWDGMIVKGDDEKYYMYGCAWTESDSHHNGWTKNSKAITAVSDNPMGPYRNMKMAYPHWNNSMGGNVMGLRMFDGRYAMISSEITRGEVFVSDNADGPWEFVDTLKIDPNGYKLTSVKYPWDLHMSNVMILPRHDGKYMMVPRQCRILIADKIDGPYKIMTESIHVNQPDLPDYHNEMLEDPTVWYSGGLYHILVNQHRYGVTHHFTSEDGIHDWKYRGVGFDTNSKIFKYSDGTLNNWYTVQRAIAFTENGHVTHFTFSVLDAHKGDDTANDNNGSKIIVVPFDGVAFDKHMAQVIKAEKLEEQRRKIEVQNSLTDCNLLNSHYASFEKVDGIVAASWQIQHPEVWSISDKVAKSGKYSLKYTPNWRKGYFDRNMVHSFDYVNYPSAQPTITAGYKYVSVSVNISKGTKGELYIDFKSDKFNKRIAFDLTKVPERNKWVTLTQKVYFEEDFNQEYRNYQISTPKNVGNMLFYVDDVCVEPLFLSSENKLDVDYYGFELSDKDDRIGYMSGWKTNSGHNTTPDINFISRDPYLTEVSFEVIKADKGVKPYSGGKCLKYTFSNLSRYQSSWFRALSDKDGLPGNDLWLKPGKYRISYMLNIATDKMNAFYICLKKNGKNYPIRTASDKVKERNKWVEVSTIVDLTKEKSPISAKLELLYKVTKVKTDFYIDDIKIEECE